MIEQEYLKYCLQEIERKLDWKPSADWRESEYVKLSKLISEKSNISISPHTLKRLFGKIKYKKYYNPQQATKEALAKYLEYSSWEAFVQFVNTRTNSNKESAKPRSNKPVFIVVLILLLVTVFFIYRPFEKPKNSKAIEAFEFDLVDSIGVVPYTISVNYDLSNVTSDSTYIDFGFNHPVRGPQTILVDKSKFRRNFTYQIPGRYFVDLISEDQTLESKRVLALSNAWDSYFNNEATNNSFWIDKKIDTIPLSGSLYYPPKYLDSIGFNTNQVYYVTHRLFKEFDIDGDNFELNLRFKNSKELGGITCYDFIFRIICENEVNHLNLMEAGCSQFSGMKIGETVLSGVHDDLSLFRLNLGSWNDLRILVENKNVSVFVNNEQIYSGVYEQANGKIIGLENVFKGTGMLDFIRIKDLVSEKSYFEDFND
ncbi:hypothetical protein [Seonamhaeicola sp.]|uniref:hypothetical protein n=1 Tax=Seonamhaeicola sp. TaxID=1912245 RepID=UPI0026205E9E|nr:hypothetical protein [Seonamhaeicola sp.]